jgi:pyruvate/2-oxoglutarate/acetoin dehydrogenase E1 component
VRIGSPDTSAPYSPTLEQKYIPGKKEIREAIKKVIKIL